MLAQLGILEDEADRLANSGDETQANMLIAATGIIRDCLEAENMIATVVVETSGVALLLAALSRICEK